jgi:hypothetical protein
MGLYLPGDIKQPQGELHPSSERRYFLLLLLFLADEVPALNWPDYSLEL